MEEWADLLTSQLQIKKERKGRPLNQGEYEDIFEAHPEWVNDDKGLIGKVMRLLPRLPTTEVGLVSSDRRLANQMAETCNVTVCRVDPLEYIRYSRENGISLDESMDPTAFFQSTGLFTKINLCDTGSVSARAANLTEINHRGDLYDRKVLDTTEVGGHRMSKVVFTKTTERLRRERHRPLKSKNWRGVRPKGDIYSSHASWARSSQPSSIYTFDTKSEWKQSRRNISAPKDP